MRGCLGFDVAVLIDDIQNLQGIHFLYFPLILVLLFSSWSSQLPGDLIVPILVLFVKRRRLV